jgi:LacI family gluconate utilization system Gnt-I transcriptional repressor
MEGAPLSRRDKRRTKLSDVAARAGVSSVTVSRALRQPDMVSPELRARIDAAVRELAYIPNRAASTLASSRSNIIGAIVSSLSNGVFADYLRALHDEFHAAGIQVVVLNSRYSPAEEEKAIVALLGQHPEAVILSDVDQTPHARRLLEHAGIPVVQTMELASNPIDINVGVSQHAAGHAATRHLLDLGHRKIGMIAARLDSRSRNRIAGYRSAMEEAGVFAEDLLALTPFPSTVKGGGDLFSELVTRVPDLEAVFCGNDDLALGVLFECNRRQIAIPDQLSLIGFNDLEFAASTFPALTSVNVPRYQMAKLSADIVLEIIRGSGERPAETRIDLGYSISLRGSTARRIR